MLESIALTFLLAPTAPWLARIAPRLTGAVMALALAGLAAWLSTHVPVVAGGTAVRLDLPWYAALGVGLSFRLDGLALLMGLLITGIGAFILLYAGWYLAGHPQIGRFYGYMMAFAGSMLGVVFADNLIVLFVFWELTSLWSYFLIGFHHSSATGRSAALQALLVTGVGGLAMLAGFLLLGQAAGGYEVSLLTEQSSSLREHGLYLPALVLILLGAFTKSAQFPFHFWLPNAMEAPTPVSAYLHSATMVKAGVYLLARLAPILGGTAAWTYGVSSVGLITAAVGAGLALLHHDLKRILAYSTISVLGLLTMLTGLPTEAAARAAITLLLAHALYKAALFLVAGAIDHETGSRDVRVLGGLGRVMWMAVPGAVFAAAFGAGLPPFVGFAGKELLYDAMRGLSGAGTVVTAVVVLIQALLMAVALIAGLHPFVGRGGRTPKHPHNPPAAIWAPPLALSAIGLVAGFRPTHIEPLLAAGASSVLGRPATIELGLWHGFTATFALGLVTFGLGAGLYWRRAALLAAGRHLDRLAQWGPDRAYHACVAGMNETARRLTSVLQHGYLRFYLMTMILAAGGLVGYSLFIEGGAWRMPAWSGASAFEWLMVALMVSACLMAVRATSRLSAVVGLGVVGYSIALLYAFYGAPDLALTQFAVETLTVIVFVLVLYRLPRFATFSTARARVRDALIASAGGGLLTALLLSVSAEPFQSRLAAYFSQNALPLGKGRNIVNVILVDFRALDTLGEITVLVAATIGIWGLLKLRPERRANP